MCEHSWLDTGHTKVCSECGLETKVLVLNVWNKFSAPLNRQYDRVGRFKTKVDKLLGAHRGPKYTDPVWGILKQEKMSSPGDVRRGIRKSKLKAKHYDCIRIFCDVFTTFRIGEIDTEMTRTRLVRMFEDVHHVWLGSGESSDGFFSYDFLLRHFLENIKSPLVVYLKPQTNKKRLQKYMVKLSLILSRSVSGIASRSSGGVHFPSVLRRSTNLQSQPQWAGGQDEPA